jgi:hypothetical protein
VCKRNVFNAIMGKKSGRGQPVSSGTKQTNIENHPMKRFRKRIRQLSEDSFSGE